jgi:hypothetical protein
VCVRKGKGFGYNHKIMIIKFKSCDLVLRLLGNLWFARVRVRDWWLKVELEEETTVVVV